MSAQYLLIDNYDSFTFNLYHMVETQAGSAEAGSNRTGSCEVHRNDQITLAEIDAMNPDAIMISPGPCTPLEAGICIDLVRRFSTRIPILGVCLGMQAIAMAFGGKVTRQTPPMHGKISTITHQGMALFANVAQTFKATRYHSLKIDPNHLPDCLHITAESDDGTIQGLSHHSLPVHGVQFHPESIASEYGTQIIANFLALTSQNRGR
ncbi:MAG: aminodeoxychorismate/anthranilate synthase component II [Pseudomonadota bacterium]